MVNNNAFDFEFVPANQLLYATAAAMGGLLGGIAAMMLLGSRMTKSKRFEKIILSSTQDKDKGFVATFFPEPMQGKKGVTHTIMRPSGKVEVDGKIYDAFSRGEYIEKGETVEIIGEDTTSLIIKKA